MKYILYHELQSFITKHYHSTGVTLSFADALNACWDAGIIHDGEIPPVDFLHFDPDDTLSILERIDQVAIPYTDETLTLGEDTSLKGKLIVFKYPDHSRAGVHVQDGLELNYVFKGSCTMYFEGKEYSLVENEVAIIPPNAHHDIYGTEGSIVFSFLIHQDLFNETFFQVIQTDTALASFFNTVLYRRSNMFLDFHIRDAQQFLIIFLAMYAEFSSQNLYRYEICVNYIRILFAQLLRHPLPTVRDNTLSEEETILLDMPAILQYIMKNFRFLNLSQLADKFHYNRSYLGKQIKKFTGSTFTDLVIGYRLQLSCDLLTNTNRSIEAISELCGYTSADHFSRSFKQIYHCSPSAYRRQHADGHHLST